jgi:isopentenyl diphosphate isomerase/L-lactate dehydrogenase-like FMN-dependent dehydrogenase
MATFMMHENLQPRPEGFSSFYEMVELAKERLGRGEWEIISLAAGTGASNRRNRMAFESLAFKQRILRDVSDVDVTTTLLGHSMAMPVFICPMSALRYMTQNGVVDMVRAAGEFGVPVAVSSTAAGDRPDDKPSLETVAAETDGVKFYQLQLRGDSDYLADRTARARAAGYAAIVITADGPLYGIRDTVNRSGHARLSIDESGKLFGAQATWETLDQIRELAEPLPIILKGVQTAEDAELAVEHGVSVVHVSNHGGRELDHQRATLSILPEILSAVSGAVPVTLDSGIRRGTDVVKALALGASAVGIGRLAAWALGAGGQAGVRGMLDLLAAEIGNTMGLIGVTSLLELNPSVLEAVPPLGMYYPEFWPRGIQPI